SDVPRPDPTARALDLAVPRYNADSTPAATFNGTGLLLIDFTNLDDVGLAVAVDPVTHQVLVGGTTHVGPSSANQDFALARVNPDGTLDATFGQAGEVTLNIRGSDVQRGLALVPRCSNLAAGTAQRCGNNEIAPARSDADGRD